MRSFARSVAVIAVVALLVAFADPSSRPTVGRVAVFAVAVAAAAGLTQRVARSGRADDRSPFSPRRSPPSSPAVPTELAQLTASFRSLAGGGRLDGQLREALELVAASRLEHHGRSLSRREDDEAVRALLGSPLVEALRSRTPPQDAEDLLRPLEAL